MTGIEPFMNMKYIILPKIEANFPLSLHLIALIAGVNDWVQVHNNRYTCYGNLINNKHIQHESDNELTNTHLG